MARIGLTLNASVLARKFDRLFIDENSRDSVLVQRLLPHFPAESVEYVFERPFSRSRGELSAREFDRSKRNLYVTPFRGSYFKRCPGAKPGLLCCNYFILNWGQQCDMNCSYCYLQSFINNPITTLYSNLENAFSELRELAGSMGSQKVRVGTGETVDSLSLDPLTGFASDLIALFREFPNWTVEFKTKSAHVDQFLNVEHAGNAIVGWSVNPSFIVDSEEHGTASLSDRLAAASKCARAGFRIAFHLDPIIWHPGWEKNYDTLVDQICERFTAEQVPYVSMGALRFQPEQRHIMRERFGMQSWVTRAEMSLGSDGKFRYPVGLRKQLFEHVQARFRHHGRDWKTYMCMETLDTWVDSPFKRGELKEIFDVQVARSFKAQAATKTRTAEIPLSSR